MRNLTAPLAVALSILWTAPAPGQFADQKALEAAVRSLHGGEDAPLIVSALMVAPNVDGNVRINDESREVLEGRLGARVAELEEVVSCDDLALPESCRIEDGATIYQFFMPEPLRDGVLHLAVMLLKTADEGRIVREWWNLALVQQPGVGWTVVEQELQDKADGPW